jgi:hypothetical protein
LRGSSFSSSRIENEHTILWHIPPIALNLLRQKDASEVIQAKPATDTGFAAIDPMDGTRQARKEEPGFPFRHALDW